MYKLIVFDLDGTLLDTLDDLASAVNYALKEHGLPVRTVDEVRAFVGNGVKNLITRAVGEHRENEAEVLSVFRAYYDKHNADETHVYEGIITLLQALKEKGVPTAVLSNKHDCATKALVKRYLDGFFHCVMGENEAGGVRKKPAPDALFALMERFGVQKNETLYIGDSEVDIETANNAGVDCLCVLWGFRDEALLTEKGATRFAHKPEEILDILNKEA